MKCNEYDFLRQLDVAVTVPDGGGQVTKANGDASHHIDDADGVVFHGGVGGCGREGGLVAGGDAIFAIE